MCSTITAIFAHARTFIIIANSSVDNLRLSWLLCSGIQVENQTIYPYFEGRKEKKQTDPKKKYSRRMMRKQHIFWSASPNYSKPRQISFKKFGFGPWHAGGKLFPMKKRKIGKAFKDDIMTSRKKKFFQNLWKSRCYILVTSTYPLKRLHSILRIKSQK